MLAKYQAWVDANVDGDPVGRCAEVTEAMAAAFPELTRVRGHYDGWAHWWLVDAQGQVIDPTADQFSPGGTYVEHVGPEPTGKCPNCGRYCYGGSFCCSDACADAYVRYVTSGIL